MSFQSDPTFEKDMQKHMQKYMADVHKALEKKHKRVSELPGIEKKHDEGSEPLKCANKVGMTWENKPFTLDMFIKSAEKVEELKRARDKQAVTMAANIEKIISRVGEIHKAKSDKPDSEEITPHYYGVYIGGIKMDPYRIASAYNIGGGPQEQIMKKCLRGETKGDDARKVIKEIKQAINRWEEMLDEDATWQGEEEHS